VKKILVGEMSFEIAGTGVLDEQPCRYGASKLLCRGPRRALGDPYVAFLGGSETYGKFVAQPFAALLEPGLGRACVNLGCINAGLDSFVHDPDILRVARGSDLTVLQVLGAQNLNNRYYRVHPRRNDRFLAPSVLLSSIYREVDFTEFHFNKHLLNTLNMLSPERFATVQAELQQVWVGRMRLLLRALGGNVLLLWLRYDPDGAAGGGLGAKPLLVSSEMLDALRPQVKGVIEFPVVPAGQTGELGAMLFGPMQGPAAEHMIGPQGHQDVAAHLLPVIKAAM
jgi:Domain of unknown function (DUF6473)